MKNKLRKKLKQHRLEKRNSLNAKILALYGLAVLIIMVVSTGIYLFIKLPSGDTSVAIVDNETVTVQEFRQQILQHRGEVIAYFRTKYGVDADKGFWTNSYGGEIPAEVVKKQALNQVIKNKKQLMLAKNEGFIEDISYKDIIKNMLDENKRRKEAVARGEIIYGQLEYNEETYFKYIMSELAKRLTENMSYNWNITDQEIENYYDKIKDDFYIQGQAVKIEKIQLSYEENGSMSVELKNQQKIKIDKAKEQLNRGENFEEIARSLNKGEAVINQVFDLETAKSDTILNPDLREICNGMEIGEISDIIEEGNSFCIVKCIENIVLSYTPLEEVKDNLKSRYIDDKYKETIDKLAKEADVKINDRVFEKAKADS